MFAYPFYSYFVVSESVHGPRRTQFQGFDIDWMLAVETLHQLVQLPASPVEFGWDTTTRIRNRALGQLRYSIWVGSSTEFEYVAQPLPFMVVFSNSKCAEKARATIDRIECPVLHVTEAPLEGEAELQSFDSQALRSWFDQGLVYFETIDRAYANELRSHLESEPASNDEMAPVFGLMQTAPADLTLRSIGYPVYRGDENVELQAKIEAGFQTVRALRRLFDTSQYPPLGTELILTTPAVLRDLPAVLRHSPHLDAAAVRAYRELIARPRLVLPEWAERLTYDSQSQESKLVNDRVGEINSQLVSVAIEAASQFCPALPLIEPINDVTPSLQVLSTFLREKAAGWHSKASAAALQLGRDMSVSLTDTAKDAIAETKGTIKVFADEPWELAYCNDRPLLLQCPVVRVPVTPGVVLSQLSMLGAARFLQAKDFEKVLVIRGLLRDDDAYSLLEQFCGSIVSEVDGVTLEVIDVHSIDDIRHCLEEFRGAMAIIDTHGIHSPRNPGSLQVGRTLATTLGHSFRVPPVIFLAACETHAMAANQFTTATTFLGMGAQTVVANVAPVGIVESAIFCGKVLERLLSWLPGAPGPIRLSELIGFSIWSCHVFEAVQRLGMIGRLQLTLTDALDIEEAVEKEIYRFDRNWLETAQRLTAERANCSEELLRNEWRKWAYLTDSLLVCQLGNPDALFLAPKTWAKPNASRAGQ